MIFGGAHISLKQSSEKNTEIYINFLLILSTIFFSINPFFLQIIEIIIIKNYPKIIRKLCLKNRFSEVKKRFSNLAAIIISKIFPFGNFSSSYKDISKMINYQKYFVKILLLVLLSYGIWAECVQIFIDVCIHFMYFHVFN